MDQIFEEIEEYLDEKEKKEYIITVGCRNPFFIETVWVKNVESKTEAIYKSLISDDIYRVSLTNIITYNLTDIQFYELDSIYPMKIEELPYGAVLKDVPFSYLKQMIKHMTKKWFSKRELIEHMMNHLNIKANQVFEFRRRSST